MKQSKIDKVLTHSLEPKFIKASGASLLVGCLLAAITMTLHPVGGDIAHISKMKNALFFSHSLAIVCMPLLSFGFWGLTQLLMTKSKTALLAFIILSFGLFAAMIAGCINGLILPKFASNYNMNDDAIKTVEKIIQYGFVINLMMTYIFISATALSLGIWSILIIKNQQISAWLGYFGLVVLAIGLLSVGFKFNFTNLLGFKTFIFLIVSWKIAVGITMIKGTSSFSNETIETNTIN
jgi:hypothetical protein